MSIFGKIDMYGAFNMNELLIYIREFDGSKWLIFYITDPYVLSQFLDETQKFWKHQVSYQRCFYCLDTQRFMDMRTDSKTNGIRSGDHLILI